MTGKALGLVIAVVWLVTGCGSRNGGPAGGDAEVESLPVLTPKSGGDMILIPGGSFTMGDAAGRPDERSHEVTVSAFYVDRLPVTQELYEKVMGVNPSKRKAPENPVERTQWTD